jgi:hypothetical protein
VILAVLTAGLGGIMLGAALRLGGTLLVLAAVHFHVLAAGVTFMAVAMLIVTLAMLVVLLAAMLLGMARVGIGGGRDLRCNRCGDDERDGADEKLHGAILVLKETVLTISQARFGGGVAMSGSTPAIVATKTAGGISLSGIFAIAAGVALAATAAHDTVQSAAGAEGASGARSSDPLQWPASAAAGACAAAGAAPMPIGISTSAINASKRERAAITIAGIGARTLLGNDQLSGTP